MPGLRVAIAHADAPEWVDVITALVHEARPQAEIELVENLGAVVGTHAGPGAVGFFWFQDYVVAVVRRRVPDPSALPGTVSVCAGRRRLRVAPCRFAGEDGTGAQLPDGIVSIAREAQKREVQADACGRDGAEEQASEQQSGPASHSDRVRGARRSVRARARSGAHAAGSPVARGEAAPGVGRERRGRAGVGETRALQVVAAATEPTAQA